MKFVGQLCFVMITFIACMHNRASNGHLNQSGIEKPILRPIDLESYSQEFFLALRTDSPFDAYLDTIEAIDLDYLETSLNTQEKKLAFWINTYNALVQVKIKNSPESFKNINTFFKERDLRIGGVSVSLDDVENGILRLKEIPDQEAFCSRFRVDSLDSRIHFTLNCGASSCPAIAYYASGQIQQQLNEAEGFFIEMSSSYNSEKNELRISELFKWFESDFGGRSGVLLLLEKYGLFDKNTNPKITYDPYDWGLSPGKYD